MDYVSGFLKDGFLVYLFLGLGWNLFFLDGRFGSCGFFWGKC